MSARPRWKKWLWVTAVVIAATVLALGSLLLALDEERPRGAPGPAADALARRLQDRAGVAAWAQLRAVRWRFAGMAEHLWDRDRGLIRVRWDDVEVLRPIEGAGAIVRRAGAPVTDAEAARALAEAAYARFVNDAFWLNPLPSLFDAGVSRGIAASADGEPGLLVHYGDGGLTPGDAYLWLVGDDGLPDRWQMWTSNIPIGGVEASWSDWLELDGGARIAARHRIWFFELELAEVTAGATLAEVEPGPDPFSALQR